LSTAGCLINNSERSRQHHDIIKEQKKKISIERI